MLKVLIAVDGSTAGDEMFRVAGELLSDKQSEVRLLHVIPRHLIYGRGGPVVAECYDPAEERSHSKSLLEDSTVRLRAAGFTGPIKTEIDTGDPADAILTVADQDQSDLIVLGSRGFNTVRRFLMGSVSSKVSTHATCAVLIVHPKVAISHGVSVGESARETVTA